MNNVGNHSSELGMLMTQASLENPIYFCLSVVSSHQQKTNMTNFEVSRINSPYSWSMGFSSFEGRG